MGDPTQPGQGAIGNMRAMPGTLKPVRRASKRVLTVTASGGTPDEWPKEFTGEIARALAPLCLRAILKRRERDG